MTHPKSATCLPQTQETTDWYYDRALNDPLKTEFQRLGQKTLCIMGAAGQVGSHFLGKCYELGFDPDQIDLNDNLSLGTPENLPPVFRARLDTRSHQAYAQNPPRHPDILVFVGGRSSAPHFTTLEDVLGEIQTWETILNWCAAQNIRLIFASTSSLCKQRPSLENQLVWPGSLYELCKLMMENMAIQQSLDAELQVQICRFFSVYGVTESHKGKFGNLYTQLLWHAIDQEPFEIWGQRDRFQPGEQTRDIIFAPDVVRAIMHLLTLPPSTPQLTDISDVVYNIGQGNPLTVNEMVQNVAAVVPHSLQPKLETVEVPNELHNYVVDTWGDPCKLIETGYQPLFPNNIENLRFIYASLSQDRSIYWNLLDQIRTHA